MDTLYGKRIFRHLSRKKVGNVETITWPPRRKVLLCCNWLANQVTHYANSVLTRVIKPSELFKVSTGNKWRAKSIEYCIWRGGWYPLTESNFNELRKTNELCVALVSNNNPPRQRLNELLAVFSDVYQNKNRIRLPPCRSLHCLRRFQGLCCYKGWSRIWLPQVLLRLVNTSSATNVTILDGEKQGQLG